MRAKPMITFGLVAGALAMAPAALALGLGRLTVDSALGQPLSARIDLTSVSRDELESLSAKIADPSLYRQNNLTYQGVLARTRVAVEYVGGNPVLKISSTAAVNEPFLDLMVELNWASGRVVREYTFLLDPPGAAEMQAAVEPAYRGGAGASSTARFNGYHNAIRRGRRRPIHGQIRRHARQDRRTIQAQRCHARSDAGRVLEPQPERVR